MPLLETVTRTGIRLASVSFLTEVYPTREHDVARGRK